LTAPECAVFESAGKVTEWERFSNIGDKNTTGQSDVDLYSIGAVFHF
jgi:hypothetical protein